METVSFLSVDIEGRPCAPSASMIELFVPGRLCLFGEHSDWAGGLRVEDATIAPGACIVTGTDQGLWATAEPAGDFEIVSRLPDGAVRGPLRIPMSVAALEQAARAGGFFSYAAGVAADICSRYGTRGARIEVTRADLPVARGLSSSAAICVLTARAFNRLHGLGLSVEEEMEIGYRGERAAGSQCGRMDQACAFGRRLVRLDFDGAGLCIQLLPADGPFHLLVVDLQRQKDTRRILAELRSAFLGANHRREALRSALGARNLGIIAGAGKALQQGDAAALGALMTEAQDLFDRCITPACAAELKAPRLHAVLAHPAVRELTWGGKGVGSQGDGAAQLICRGPAERTALAAELERALAVKCLPLTIGKMEEKTED